MQWWFVDFFSQKKCHFFLATSSFSGLRQNPVDIVNISKYCKYRSATSDALRLRLTLATRALQARRTDYAQKKRKKKKEKRKKKKEKSLLILRIYKIITHLNRTKKMQI